MKINKVLKRLKPYTVDNNITFLNDKIGRVQMLINKNKKEKTKIYYYNLHTLKIIKKY